MSWNRKSGKVSILGLGAVAMVGLIVASLFFAKEDPASIGTQFMDALARHDVEKLTSLTYIGKSNPTEFEAEQKKFHDQWDFCVNTAGEHFFFRWKIAASSTASPTSGSVTVMVEKVGPGSYEEKYELPMEKEGDKWKIDATSISRTMFPGLPEG